MVLLCRIVFAVCLVVEVVLLRFIARNLDAQTFRRFAWTMPLNFLIMAACLANLIHVLAEAELHEGMQFVAAFCAFVTLLSAAITVRAAHETAKYRAATRLQVRSISPKRHRKKAGLSRR
jgi:hypothetical protein